MALVVRFVVPTVVWLFRTTAKYSLVAPCGVYTNRPSAAPNVYVPPWPLGTRQLRLVSISFSRIARASGWKMRPTSVASLMLVNGAPDRYTSQVNGAWADTVQTIHVCPSAYQPRTFDCA